MADELFQSSKTNLWGFGVGIKPPLARRSPAGVLCLCWLFQSPDWVDVYSGVEVFVNLVRAFDVSIPRLG